MYYFDYAYTSKNSTKVKTKSGAIKVKKAASCKNRFHYITRTAHYANHKDNINEQVEFVRSGNMPSFAKNRPDLFWEAAQMYERKNARTAASLVIALPKELTPRQRIELTEELIKQFTNEFNFPYSAAIHNHKSEIAGQDQPHLHIMYSERSVDEHDRTAEQFFSRYNDKAPEKGGAQKITPDSRGIGKTIINQMRVETEVIINEALDLYAPTKIINIKGIDIEVPNRVSCLHHKDYNAINKTDLKAVPQIPKEILRLNQNLFFEDKEKDNEYKTKLAEREAMITEITEIRDHNNFEMYQQYYYAQLEQTKQAEKQIKQEPRPKLTADSTSLTKHLKYMNAYADDVILWSKKQDEAWSKNDYKQAISYMSNKYSPLQIVMDKQDISQLEQTKELIENDKGLLEAVSRSFGHKVVESTATIVNNALTSNERKIEHIKRSSTKHSKEVEAEQTYRNDSPSPDF